MPRMLSGFKRFVFKPGRAPHSVWSGAFRGLRMAMDPASESQCIVGLHEREVHRCLGRLAAGIRSAVDIGAAAGEYTLYALSRTSAERVFAFDPDPATREGFNTNLELNGLIDDARLRVSSHWVRSTPQPDAVTLDQLLPDLLFPCWVKMDVDGGEIDILKGATELLKLRQTRWLIETHSVELERDCLQILRENGYEVTIITNAWWRFMVPELRPIAHNRWLTAVPTESY